MGAVTSGPRERAPRDPAEPLKGATIVVIDPYGSPTIGRDLRTFDRAEGVPNPPSLRMAIANDMNIVVHPTYLRGHVLSWVCDNYLIEADGPSERLHRFPEAITELG